jgi:hypothetical protein
MSINEELHSLVDQLHGAEAEDALEYLRWLASEDDTLTDEELAEVKLGEEQIRRGEYVWLTDLRRSLSE